MCRIPRVVVIADPQRGEEIRSAVSSLEFEVVAVAPPGTVPDVVAEIALVDGPADFDALRQAGYKTASVGGSGSDLDLTEASEFKTRIWELYR